jgi:pimeloyl-ACP methyl ester carboxylesterase
VLPNPTGEYLVPTRDGRQLDVREWGDPDGLPVFFLHGTPGGALLRHVDVTSGDDVYRERHLRVVTYARPGYGRSTPRPGRRVVDDADDVEAVADALHLERFGVTGVSGGGGATLAVGARLSDRATRAAVIAGVVPLGAADLDYFDGMDEAGRQWYLDLTGPNPDAALDKEWHDTVDWVHEELPNLQLTPGLREMLQTAAEDGMSPGPAGMRDDGLALVGDWGFDVSDVRIPVRLLYAEDDTTIPPGHARWLYDRLPDCELTWIPGDHLGAGVEQERSNRELQLLAWAAPEG